MTARARTETAAHPAGDRARILAIGQVYLGFAVAEPALFRMMFGQRPTVSSDEIALARGSECFQLVVQEVVSHCTINRVEGDARMIALHLWTLVHGAASLTIDGDYTKVAADIAVADILQQGAERLLFSRPRAPAEAIPGTGA